MTGKPLIPKEIASREEIQKLVRDAIDFLIEEESNATTDPASESATETFPPPTVLGRQESILDSSVLTYSRCHI